MNKDLFLSAEIGKQGIKQESTRVGFGRGLVAAGVANPNVVALCADLTESLQMADFKETFTDRFVQVGVAEQNLVTIASGMAAMGKIPFAGSYAAFCPGRCWEQIRTTICINDQPVKIIGSHAGVSVGPDGATHQMLEDIALMRSLPNMVVIAPGDSIEAQKATMAMAANGKPSYMRLARPKTPVFTTLRTPFEIGKAYTLRSGDHVTLLGTGILTYQLLLAADILAKDGIRAEVVHVPTIKPLDEKTIIKSVQKTGLAVTAEEAQVAGGFGGAVAELLSANYPTRLLRIGVQDKFGESGEPDQLLEVFGLKSKQIALRISTFMDQKGA